MTQTEKAAAFKALHQSGQTFIAPNPWDTGSAKLLEHAGFQALATTSLGAANSLGEKRISKSQTINNCATISAATSLPVSADLENGFADTPENAAQIIVEAADAGIVGGSIEDFTGDPSSPIYDFSLAVERVQACAETARKLPFSFTFTARAENLLYGYKDLDESIRRLQAFSDAGADVLYAPGVYTIEDIRTLVSAVDKPVNVVMGLADPAITLDDLQEAGVSRISIGGALNRVALNSFMQGVHQLRRGRFDFVRDMANVAEIHAAF